MWASTKIALPTVLIVTALQIGCNDPTQTADTASATMSNVSDSTSARVDSCDNASENRTALFGDVHIHTRYSFDAAANSTGTTPEDAHRYARGEEIPIFPVNDQGVAIGRTKIDRPLDFIAVTDHGEFLGERRLCRSSESPVYGSAFCKEYRSDERLGMIMLSNSVVSEAPIRIPEICGQDGSLCLDYARSPWEDIQATSNKANTPCEFTSFIAYEYTGTPGVSNYHRNVIFRNESVSDLPVSYIDAPIDSKLWATLDARCDSEQGCDYLTIPHNTNLSNGRMAPYMKLDDTLEAKRNYAISRLKREPIMEVFQHKGGSECINGLSTVFGAPDELCEVEAVRQIGKSRSILVRDYDAPGIVMQPASVVTEECQEGEVGENGMLGAGCVHPTDFQRSVLLVV